MSKDQEVGIDVSFRRKYNLGNFNDKEYFLKVSGTESQVAKQLGDEKQKLTNFIAQLEEIVDIANDANKLKARLEASAVPAKTSTKMEEL